MNVLFLTLSSIEDINQSGIYTDFIRVLSKNGLQVYVVSPRQKGEGLQTQRSDIGNIHLLKVRTGNIKKTRSLIAKGFATVNIKGQYIRAIKKYFNKVRFDLIICSTPPITLYGILKFLKEKHGSKTYLM